MTRIPPLGRDDMDASQVAVHDRIVANNGRVGVGPAIGYAYSAEVWRLHSESSAHLLDCALTPGQVRIVSLMTVRHWNASYPWNAQAGTAQVAGVSPATIEAIKVGRPPAFDDHLDAAVYHATRELLATGTLSEEAFSSAVASLGYKRLVEVVATIGHFCTTALMANVVGAVPPADAVFQLQTYSHKGGA